MVKRLVFVQVLAVVVEKVVESVPPESWRPLPTVVVARAPAPFPVRSVLAAMLVQPVPPFPTESAFTKESEPKEALDAERFVEEAVVAKKVVEVALARMAQPETVRFVVEALVKFVWPLWVEEAVSM